MFLNSAFKSYNVQYVRSYVAVNACMPSHSRICPYISPCISSEFFDRVTENKTRFLLLYSPGYKSVYLCLFFQLVNGNLCEEQVTIDDLPPKLTQIVKVLELSVPCTSLEMKVD